MNSRTESTDCASGKESIEMNINLAPASATVGTHADVEENAPAGVKAHVAFVAFAA